MKNRESSMIHMKTGLTKSHNETMIKINYETKRNLNLESKKRRGQNAEERIGAAVSYRASGSKHCRLR